VTNRLNPRLRSSTFGPTVQVRACVARRAFTLLEVVVVMATLSLVMLIAGGIFFGSFRIIRAISNNYRDLTAVAQLADQFRADVGQATGTSESFGQDRAGPDCLILKESKGRHVIYRRQSGRLERIEFAGSRQSKHQLSLGGDNVRPEFARSKRGPAIVTLRLVETGQRGPKKELEISAALGGDIK